MLHGCSAPGRTLGMTRRAFAALALYIFAITDCLRDKEKVKKDAAGNIFISSEGADSTDTLTSGKESPPNVTVLRSTPLGEGAGGGFFVTSGVLDSVRPVSVTPFMVVNPADKHGVPQQFLHQGATRPEGESRVHAVQGNHQASRDNITLRTAMASRNLTAAGNLTWLPRPWANMSSLKRSNLTRNASFGIADEDNTTKVGGLKSMIFALGSSSGLNAESQGRGMRTRQKLYEMRCQHMAAIIAVLTVFCGFLSVSLSLVYQQVQQRARESQHIKYYAHFGTEIGMSESAEIDEFISTFDKPPANSRLVIMGLELQPRGSLNDMFNEFGLIRWKGKTYRVAFNFSLDLTPWVTHANSEAVHISDEDYESLRNFLTSNTNDLATVEIQKDIAWPGWEELATNIKTSLRQLGFHGLVQIKCEGFEHLEIRKNSAWAHFLRNRLTRALIALSLVGWVFYALYMLMKRSTLVIKSHHKVQVSIEQYWELIGDKLTSQGFDAAGITNTSSPPSSGRERER